MTRANPPGTAPRDRGGRLARAAFVAAVLLGGAALASCGDGDAASRPAGSTLEATLVDPDGDGELARGAGEPLVGRTELGGAAEPGEVLATLAQITDSHVRDEESPARVPFLDRLGPPFNSTFRPHEALSAQVLAAVVRSVNRLGPDAVVVTGDIVDSAAAVELDQALAVLDGGAVDPDTGGRGYDGVQADEQPDPLYYRPGLDPPRHPGLLAAAARPFRSPGLTAPWYPALGNHDLLVQGETPPTDRIDAVATGTRMVVGLDPGLRPNADTDAARAVDALLAAGAPGRAIDVPADARRRHLRPGELIARLTGRERAPAELRAAGEAAADGSASAPDGTGDGGAAAGEAASDDSPTEPDGTGDGGAAAGEAAADGSASAPDGASDGAALAGEASADDSASAPDGAGDGAGGRLDYRFDAGAVRALVLDTVDRRGGSRGLLRPAQIEWLRAELRAAAGRPLLVFSHNPLDNTIRGDAALAALDATPGVVAVIAGNSHRNRIRPRATSGSGYWQVSTSSLADHPQQARALRVRRTAAGYALETWMLDHDGEGVAAAARELAFLDAQGGRPQGFAGGRGDRNARLFVRVR